MAVSFLLESSLGSWDENRCQLTVIHTFTLLESSLGKDLLYEEGKISHSPWEATVSSIKGFNKVSLQKQELSIQSCWILLLNRSCVHYAF